MGAHRIERQSYPPIAIREALCNAIVHRDYDISSPIIVNIYPNFMEVISVGALGKGLTLEDVSSGVSYARNQVIADVFFRLGLIESYGTGIRHILRSYQEEAEKPVFLANPKSFVVKLPNRNQT